jgi:GNAT superfamily N-acetyltransferase
MVDLINRYDIKLETSPAAEDRRKVRDGLYTHNKARTGDGKYEDMTFLLQDADGEVIGGLLAEIYWGWIHIDVLWVHENIRGQGCGQKLMKYAENEAINRGCRAAFLDTFSFQALNFYLKLGYGVYGELPDFPTGFTRYFLKKQIINSGDKI